jgi:ribulose 1,5-bisphosphate synthetase/thiazole synthase
LNPPNPKSEARNPKQIQSTKKKARNGSRRLRFVLSSFEIRACFGFRASDFGFRADYCRDALVTAASFGSTTCTKHCSAGVIVQNLLQVGDLTLRACRATAVMIAPVVTPFGDVAGRLLIAMTITPVALLVAQWAGTGPMSRPPHRMRWFVVFTATCGCTRVRELDRHREALGRRPADVEQHGPVDVAERHLPHEVVTVADRVAVDRADDVARL